MSDMNFATIDVQALLELKNVDEGMIAVENLLNHRVISLRWYERSSIVKSFEQEVSEMLHIDINGRSLDFRIKCKDSIKNELTEIFDAINQLDGVNVIYLKI